MRTSEKTERRAILDCNSLPFLFTFPITQSVACLVAGTGSIRLLLALLSLHQLSFLPRPGLDPFKEIIIANKFLSPSPLFLFSKFNDGSSRLIRRSFCRFWDFERTFSMN